MMSAEGSYGMAAYENKELVGMILGRKETYYDAEIFEIKEFCVDVKMKGNGFGSEILEEFTKRLKSKGISRIFLFTSRGDATEGFYKKHNFDTWDDMIIMGKDI